jgi:hypothetical protein
VSLHRARGGTTILVTYGGVLVIVEAMVQMGLIQAPAAMNWKAFHWHLFVWDPWFLLWASCSARLSGGLPGSADCRDQPPAMLHVGRMLSPQLSSELLREPDGPLRDSSASPGAPSAHLGEPVRSVYDALVTAGAWS